jgi:hypothetical protein
MKKFLTQFLLFVAPVVILGYAADFYLGKALRKSHIARDEYPVWNDILDGKLDASILIYGSSTAWVQINPAAIADSLHTTAYNLGIDGHNFWLQYLRHRLLLQHNPPPALIIQTLDIFTLQKRANLFNPDQFLPYMLFNREIKRATVDYEGYHPLDYHLPLVRYYGKRQAISTAMRLSLTKDTGPEQRVKGYEPQDKPWTDDLAKAKKSMAYFEASLDTASLDLFEKYIQECKSKNIKMVFVYPPEYAEGQKFIHKREMVIALYAALGRKYNIPFFDYSSDALSFERNNFFNSLHLNKTGATLFTNKLISELKKLD